jgi:hypothetical protein
MNLICFEVELHDVAGVDVETRALPTSGRLRFDAPRGRGKRKKQRRFHVWKCRSVSKGVRKLSSERARRTHRRAKAGYGNLQGGNRSLTESAR